MRVVLAIILMVLASGCLGGEEPKEPRESPDVGPEVLPEVETPQIKILGEYPMGDFGRLKNLTVLTKEITVGNESYAYYQALYTWDGVIYRSGALNWRPPDENGSLPVGPPRAPGDAYNAAFQWIRNTTPEDALFLSWWDYGDLIRIFAQRDALISDPCPRSECFDTLSDDEKDVFRYEDVERFEDVVKFFTSSEEEAYKIAGKYGVDYVFVTYEDFSKSWAIEYLAGKDRVIKVFNVPRSGDKDRDLENLANMFAQHRVSAYYVKGDPEKYVVWYITPEDILQIKERLLLNLLPFRIYPENVFIWDMLNKFKLVYQEENYIYIFKVE
jgi:hydroxylamine oxidation protein HaoB